MRWTAETFTNLARPVTERWPEVREKIAPVAQVVGEKLGDIYASVAQVVTEQKEAFDDRLAERRARKQGAPTPPADS